MAWATCKGCSHRVAWAQHRGARLRDVACTACGRKGLLEGEGTTGKRLVVCPLCRRRMYHPRPVTRELERAARVWARGRPATGRAVEVAAGAVVCRDHQVEPLDLQGGMDGQPVLVHVHPHVERRMKVPGLNAEQTYRAVLQRQGTELVAQLQALGFLTLPLTDCAWRPVPREEVPSA